MSRAGNGGGLPLLALTEAFQSFWGEALEHSALQVVYVCLRGAFLVWTELEAQSSRYCFCRAGGN